MANLFFKNICDFSKKIYYFIKKYLYVAIVEKLYIKSIFTLEKIPQFATSNHKTLAQMNNEEKKLLMKGLENITAYNQDFVALRAEYLLSSNGAANLEKFRDFIRDTESGFYLKKAILNFIFKVLLILLQLFILFYNYPKYFCIDKLNKGNAHMFWINNNKKYEVKEVVRDKLYYLRIISFIFDLIILGYELYDLLKLQRIKATLINILIFQFFRFSVYGIIIYFEYSEQRVHHGF